MRRRIDAIATKNGCSNYEEYVKILKSDKEKFEQFVNFLTINVSEFYRNPDQWKLMDEKVIPKLLKEQGRRLKIWSAACSTGDEPYSLAMAFSKHVPLADIQILATDIDKQVIAHAQVGLYNEKSIAGVPADLKKKYFKKVGNSYQIADEIKRCVTFREHNLLKDTYPQGFDLILCRNVVIYFTDEAKNMIYQATQFEVARDGALTKSLNLIVSGKGGTAMENAKKAVANARAICDAYDNNKTDELSDEVQGILKELKIPEGHTMLEYLGFMTPKAFENANLDPEKTHAFTYKNTTFYSTWIKKS